jgi:hypothetical protein
MTMPAQPPMAWKKRPMVSAVMLSAMAQASEARM